MMKKKKKKKLLFILKQPKNRKCQKIEEKTGKKQYNNKQFEITKIQISSNVCSFLLFILH